MLLDALGGERRLDILGVHVGRVGSVDERARSSGHPQRPVRVDLAQSPVRQRPSAVNAAAVDAGPASSPRTRSGRGQPPRHLGSGSAAHGRQPPPADPDRRGRGLRGDQAAPPTVALDHQQAERLPAALEGERGAAEHMPTATRRRTVLNSLRRKPIGSSGATRSARGRNVEPLPLVRLARMAENRSSRTWGTTTRGRGTVSVDGGSDDVRPQRGDVLGLGAGRHRVYQACDLLHDVRQAGAGI